MTTCTLPCYHNFAHKIQIASKYMADQNFILSSVHCYSHTDYN